jgi:hypothetical protein
LVVTRSDHWQLAVNLFQHHAGSNNNLQLIKKLARDEDIRLAFDQLPVCICYFINHEYRFVFFFIGIY